MRAVLLGCALLAACSYPEERFATQLADATCEWTYECLPELVAELDDPCPPADLSDLDCLYDPSEGRACVIGVNQMECPEEGERAVWPAACDRVYDCEEDAAQ